ncbi:MAG: DUF3105 domain-containing protein [Myxococcales bacterium]|nr:DUF3105 domain-containing protein [Myxococcales bacterium]
MLRALPLFLLLAACEGGTVPLDEAPPVDRAVVAPAADAGLPPGPDHGLDSFDPTCRDDAWDPGACDDGQGERRELAGQAHLAVDVPITYADDPPASGDHRGEWARWGAYSALPPQRWLHNLEHGGVAFLYHPCADAADVEALRAVIRARVAVDPAFRYILTPYADLPAAVAVVAWEWRYLAPCVQADVMDAFIDQHYRQAPEDIAADGGYAVGFLGPL